MLFDFPESLEPLPEGLDFPVSRAVLLDLFQGPLHVLEPAPGFPVLLKIRVDRVSRDFRWLAGFPERFVEDLGVNLAQALDFLHRETLLDEGVFHIGDLLGRRVLDENGETLAEILDRGSGVKILDDALEGFLPLVSGGIRRFRHGSLLSAQVKAEMIIMGEMVRGQALPGFQRTF